MEASGKHEFSLWRWSEELFHGVSEPKFHDRCRVTPRFLRTCTPPSECGSGDTLHPDQARVLVVLGRSGSCIGKLRHEYLVAPPSSLMEDGIEERRVTHDSPFTARGMKTSTGIEVALVIH